jgi:iron uptake system EfeUOB component EfeO/EfeM
MKRSHLIVALALVGSLSLAGCSSSSNEHAGHDSAAQQQETSEIKAGVDKMLEVTAEIKKSVEAGDEAKVKEAGAKLEEAWGPFEDKVKEKYPDLYKKVEDALDPTIAGTEASPLDKETVGKFNDQLTQALQELADKEK